MPNLLTRDFRSVGELLADTDFQARQLLFDLVADDAPNLIVAWPQVLSAARDLWVELPLPATPIAAEQCGRAMDLLAARGNGYLTQLSKAHAYLGDIQPDARLLDIADTLARATKLVHKFAGDVDTSREPAKSDLAAARTRLLHTLYLTIHAVHASTQLLRKDIATGPLASTEVLPGLRRYRLPRVVEILDAWIHRFGSTEAAIGRALNGQYPRVIDDEVVPPADGVVRLPRALATWEILIHRLLAANPSNADITLIARTEGLIAAASHHIITADPSQNDPPLVAHFEEAAAHWAKIASWWQILTPPTATAHSQLLAASAELRASTRAFTLDRTHLAEETSIAEHPEHAAAVQALMAALEDGRDIARTVSAYSHDPNLCGPARAISRAAQDLTEHDGRAEDIVWVSPVDTMTNKMVPLPRPVIEALHGDAAALEFAASLVASAVTQRSTTKPPNEVQGTVKATARGTSQPSWDPAEPDEYIPAGY